MSHKIGSKRYTRHPFNDLGDSPFAAGPVRRVQITGRLGDTFGVVPCDRHDTPLSINPVYVGREWIGRRKSNLPSKRWAQEMLDRRLGVM